MYQRLGKYALDPDNKTEYLARADQWADYTEKWQSYHKKQLAKAVKSGIIKHNKATPKNVSECKDINELRKHFENNYSVTIDESVDDLNYESVNEASQGIETVLREFPQAQSSLKSIGTSTAHGVMNADYDGNINFNPFYYTERKKTLYGCKSETHYHPIGNNVMSTGAHEAGHMLEKALIDKALGSEQPVGNVFWNTGEQAKKIVSQACKSAKKRPDCKGKRKRVLIEEISGYAWDGKESECLAEAVADYILNKDKSAPLSQEIWKLLKEALG